MGDLMSDGSIPDDGRPPLAVVDYLDGNTQASASVSADEVPPLPESFGRNLDTITKARQWLTNPHNWFESELFILKWDGLLPRISRKHGMRLRTETWDDGLPWCAVFEQKQRRTKKERGEALEESESGPSGEPSLE
jgi:hypothetical protein